MMTTGSEEEQGFSAEGRVLCADGACIGVVGSDGRCKVCGKSADAAALAGAGTGAGDVPAAPAGDEVGDVAVFDETEHPEGADDFTERRLCPDDACIGVLDSDGRCKVCGRTGPSV